MYCNVYYCNMYCNVYCNVLSEAKTVEVQLVSKVVCFVCDRDRLDLERLLLCCWYLPGKVETAVSLGCIGRLHAVQARVS